MKTINIGIIGPGRVGQRHASALAEINSAQLWSVGGRSIESAALFAMTHKASSTRNGYDDLSLMLEDPELDAVIIATPDKLHTEHILLAAKTHKAILVEKPLCTSIKEGQKILEACLSLNLVAAVAYHLRWHKGLRTVAQKAHHHEFGEIRHLSLNWAVNFHEHGKWRSDSKLSRWFCLSVLGTHLVDILRWIMVPLCGEVIELKSIINKISPSDFDKTALLVFKFESGATAEIYCSVEYDLPFRLALQGSKKNVWGDDLAGEHKNRRIIIENEMLDINYTNPYVDQLAHFVNYFHGEVEPEVSLVEALKNVAHLEAIK